MEIRLGYKAAAAIAAILGGVMGLMAQTSPLVKETSSKIEKADTKIIVDSRLDVTGLTKMKSDREVWITPVLKSESGRDSLDLTPVCLAGHNRYYILLRKTDSESERLRIHRAKNVNTLDIHEVADYQPWMEHGQIFYRALESGCCDKPVALGHIPGNVFDFEPVVFEPVWAYITPPAEKKTRALSGSAYIDFPVNRTELYPDYRRNPEELKSIQASINSVKNDADITIDSLVFKGYASPEGPYKNNERLAAGRTLTVIDYVRDLYAFPEAILYSASEPEDWEGLVARLKLTDIANRDAIIGIASDKNIAPDPRNEKIKKDFPVQYAWILQNIYPALRHTDYTIHYTVVEYTDLAKIAELLKTQPQKLSLGEMFSLANTMEPESDEYREVFEVAVRMYPNSEVANINAANTALRHRDFKAAEKYLSKSGDSARAKYIRGLSQALQGNYEEALGLFRQASEGGCAQANDAIKQLYDKKMIKK